MFPIFPSPSPYITSVGGTAWASHDPTKPIAWEGGGGGFSWSFAAPAHQQAAVAAYLGNTSGLPPASQFNASGRAYPDLSAVAEDGTSESSPTVAGIFSQIVDRRLNAGLGGLGFLGPRLWKVASQFPGSAFEDITAGNTKTSCDSGLPSGTATCTSMGS